MSNSEFSPTKERLSPLHKLFARIIRFQSALQKIHRHEYQYLLDVAFDNGYSDQSHFIREFKEFSGLKPGSYKMREVPFICQHKEWNLAFN